MVISLNYIQCNIYNHKQDRGTVCMWSWWGFSHGNKGLETPPNHPHPGACGGCRTERGSKWISPVWAGPTAAVGTSSSPPRQSLMPSRAAWPGIHTPDLQWNAPLWHSEHTAVRLEQRYKLNKQENRLFRVKLHKQLLNRRFTYWWSTLTLCITMNRCKNV